MVVVSITKFVCEWYLVTVVIMHMMLKKKEERKKRRRRKERKGIDTNGNFKWHYLAIRVWIANGINEVSMVPAFRATLISNSHWLAIRVWIANGINEVSSVPTFLKLISWSRAIGWLMMLVKITNIGMVTPGSVKKISWLTIPVWE